MICSHLLNQKADAAEGEGGCGQITPACDTVHLNPLLEEPLAGDGVAAIASLSLSV